MMNTPADIVADSAVYLRIYFAGIIFVLIYNMGSAILRATGDSKRPLYYLIVCCIINIVLDVLFVIVFHMGVMGVAVATLIAQAVSAVLVTLKLMRSEGILKLSVKQIRFHGSILKMQLKLGLRPDLKRSCSLLQILPFNLLSTLSARTQPPHGQPTETGRNFWMVSTAFGIAITTFVGQNYGAGKWIAYAKVPAYAFLWILLFPPYLLSF